MIKKITLAACVLASFAGAVSAQEQVVNLYSARHYTTEAPLSALSATRWGPWVRPRSRRAPS